MEDKIIIKKNPNGEKEKCKWHFEGYAFGKVRYLKDKKGVWNE